MEKFNSKREKDKLPYRKVAECYLIYKNKIVAQDGKIYLSLPGGGIDRGESPEQGAMRELLEEVGAKLKGKLQLISTLKWDWDPSWANTQKRKNRYMKFRGEHVYAMFGVVEKFIKPTDVDNDAWRGSKLMTFKKAKAIAERVLKTNTPANQYGYNSSKLHIVSTISSLHSKKMLIE
tara:strand:- start:654 stop:1184 length:531 start_codon:yes stop_codon:yes gene_type:complete